MTYAQEAALAETLLAYADTPEQRGKVVSCLAEKISPTAVYDASFSTANLLAEVLRQSNEDPAHSILTAAARHEAWQSLQTFVLIALQNTEATETSGFKSIIQLCSRLTPLANILVSVCLQRLSFEAVSLASHPNGFVISIPEELGTATKSDDESENATVPPTRNIDILQCLALVKVLAWDGSLIPYFPVDAEAILLVLVCARNTNIVSTCLDALLALINCRERHFELLHRSPSHEFRDIAWARIRQLTSKPSDMHSNDTGFAIWSSLVSGIHIPFPNASILTREEYWGTLQKGLAYGSAQNRKSCLFILKMSLARVDSEIQCYSMVVQKSALKQIQLAYARYTTLFETIVLARYLNQVQDCLDELTTVSRSESRVRATWIVALAQAALAHGMQDSIRKLIGDWIMKNGVRVLQDGLGKAPEFLENCFLPWASLGHHFTSSVKYVNSRRPKSGHGEQLCKFLKDLLVFDMEQHDRTGIIKAMLKFLVAKTGRVYQTARAFILEAIVQTLNNRHQELDLEVVNLVLQASTVAGFTELVRDLMLLQCEYIIGFANSKLKPLQNAQPLHRACYLLRESLEYEEDYATAAQHFLPSGAIADTSAEIQSEHHGETPLHIVSIETLYSCINNSHTQFLSGSGLKKACICLSRALECENFENVETDKLHHLLYSIWDEVEVQEHPKQIVMRIPRIFLHPRCVRFCENSPALKSTLSNITLELQRLAEHRVYVYAPLAAALRTLCIFVPEAVELPLVELFSTFATHPTNTGVEFELEDAVSSRLEAYVPHRTYSAYYGEKEAYGHACIYDSLNRMPHNGAWIDIRRKIIDKILEPWIKQEEPVVMISRWKSSAQLQTILIVFEGLVPHLSDDSLDYYLTTLLRLLSMEPMPRLRHLLEWIIARICMLKPARRIDILRSLKNLDLSNPKHLVSMQKIAMTLARLPDSDEAFGLEFMTELMPLAASPKVAVRHEAQWTVPVLWAHGASEDWKSITHNPAFARLNSHIRSLDVYKNPPPGRLLENLDLLMDHTLAGIFQGSYLRIAPVEAQKVLKEDFLTVYADDKQQGSVLVKSQNNGIIPLGEAPKDSQSTTQQINESLHSAKDSVVPGQITIPLQTKASTWEDGVVGSSDAQGDGGGRRSRDVIVICSLINNAYNIGGLSRVCEIFGVKSLQVANLQVVKNKDFISVSVSSHLWLPIEQLEVDAIPDYLVQRKLEGYTVIGIEQTDSSKVLGRDDWKFPQRTVLVLGSEREGISARLLAEMDLCVEIRQVGITRSMNVQTAAATVLYEYSRQYP